MRRGIKKPRGIKVIQYAERLIDFNEYLALFPGDNLYDKIGGAELNEILFNRMPNNWSKQAYVQGFYCESISFKKSFNMFELMEISESIYKVVV